MKAFQVFYNKNTLKPGKRRAWVCAKGMLDTHDSAQQHIDGMRQTFQEVMGFANKLEYKIVEIPAVDYGV